MAHDAESADFYERQARVHDDLTKRKAAANQAAEAAKAQQQEFADMREAAERELDDWCREQGLGPKAPDIDDDQPQDRQIQGRQLDDDQPQGGQAYEWLATALANGPRLQSELMAQAKAAGISQRSLERAKAALGVKSFRQGKPWYWTLPAVSDAMPPGADPPGEPDLSPPPIAINAESGPMPPEAISQPCFQCGKPMKPPVDTMLGWECENCDDNGNSAWKA